MKNINRNLKKAAIIVCCAYAFLFAQNQNSDKKRLYFGLRLGGGIGLSVPSEFYKNLVLGDTDLDDYISDDDPIQEYPPEFLHFRLEWRDGGGSFDFAPFVSLQLSDFFAVQTEMLFTKYGYVGFDVVKGKLLNGYYLDDNGEVILTPIENGVRQTRHALIFPILAKLTFRPGKLSIQAFAGPHFTVNVGKFKENEDGKVTLYENDKKHYGIKMRQPPIGLTAGANFGVKAGSGTIFFDARYFTDLGYYGWADYNYRSSLVRRARLSLTAGYEFGAISR